MNLERASILANAEIEKHHPRTRGWKFKFDSADKRFGSCNYYYKQITISRTLTELNSEEEFLETLRHEIAHAIAGRMAGHGHDWKLACIMTGAKPKACYSPMEVVCGRKQILIQKTKQLDDILNFRF